MPEAVLKEGTADRPGYPPHDPSGQGQIIYLKS